MLPNHLKKAVSLWNYNDAQPVNWIAYSSCRKYAICRMCSWKNINREAKQGNGAILHHDDHSIADNYIYSGNSNVLT